MTNFRSKKDGTHYPLKGGKQVYPSEGKIERKINKYGWESSSTIPNVWYKDSVNSSRGYYTINMTKSGDGYAVNLHSGERYEYQGKFNTKQKAMEKVHELMKKTK